MGKTFIGNIKRGSKWFSGVDITGDSKTPMTFGMSGIDMAFIDDYYLNTETGRVYRCVYPGNPTTANWVYVSNMSTVSETDASLKKEHAAADAKAVGDAITVYNVTKEVDSFYSHTGDMYPRFSSIVYTGKSHDLRSYFVGVGNGKMGYCLAPSNPNYAADWAIVDIANKVFASDGLTEADPHTVLCANETVVAIGYYQSFSIQSNGDSSLTEVATACWIDERDSGTNLYNSTPIVDRNLAIRKAWVFKDTIYGCGINSAGEHIIATAKVPDMTWTVYKVNNIEKDFSDMIMLDDGRLVGVLSNINGDVLTSDDNLYITTNPYDVTTFSGYKTAFPLSCLCHANGFYYGVGSDMCLYRMSNPSYPSDWVRVGTKIEGATEINDLIYTNDRCFVAVGNGIYRSDKDLNWSVLETEHTLYSIAYGWNILLAVGRTSSFGGVICKGTHIVETTYANEAIDAVKDEVIKVKEIAEEADILNLPTNKVGNFTAEGVTGIITGETYGIYPINGELIAPGDSALHISKDGINWTSLSNNALTRKVISIAYGNGVYLVLLESASISLRTSSLEAPYPSWGRTNSVSGTISEVCFINGEFLAFVKDYPIYKSANGTIWGNLDGAANVPITVAKAIYVHDKYIIISDDGTEMYYSSDGLKTWVACTMDPNFGIVKDIIYVDELDMFYACGSNTASTSAFGMIASSKTGIGDWNVEYVASSNLNQVTSIAYGGGTLVAIGSHNTYGRNWSLVSDGSGSWTTLDGDLAGGSVDKYFSYVAFLNNRFVSVGSSTCNKYADIITEESTTNDAISSLLFNEKNEPFNFSMKEGLMGFRTGFGADSPFYPFLQNIPQIVAQGEITIAATTDAATHVPMEKNCLYLMPVLDITISTGVIRGYRTYIIYTSEDVSTKQGLLTKVSLASGGTSALSIADVKTEDQFGVNIKPNAIAYKTVYSLIKLMY